MQWSDVSRVPTHRTLRQFAGLCLVVFVGLGGWRVWQGHADVWATVLIGGGLGIGVVGLLWPPGVRWIFTGWLMAAFPIGWTISWLVLGLLFYGLFTPVGVLFRLRQRDALHLRRRPSASYWTPKGPRPDAASYFRQS